MTTSSDIDSGTGGLLVAFLLVVVLFVAGGVWVCNSSSNTLPAGCYSMYTGCSSR